MTLNQILFSFGGRINRAKFWLGLLVYLLLDRVLYATWTVQHLEGPFKWPDLSLSNVVSSYVAFLEYVVPILAWAFVPFWCLLAIGVKRLHDRGKSGWWMLVFILPGGIRNTVESGYFYHGTKDWPTWIAIDLSIAAIIVLFWAIIELGLLRGTAGANQYGENPLVPAKG